MSRAKYIIVEVGGFFVPIVFSEVIVHREMANYVTFNKEINVIGAGFCHIQDSKYVCYGESISLNVKSRGQVDSDYLNQQLGGS